MPAVSVDQADAAQVLALVTPTLYSKNLFRVLGVPVTATPKDVHRRQKRLDMERKLGTNDAQTKVHGLLTVPNPNDDDIRVALERLSDPKARLLDEIFWFWPIDGNAVTDLGLEALGQGDVQGALTIWGAGSGSPAQEATKLHNRTVLNHLIALELDAWIRAHSNPTAGSKHYQNQKLMAQSVWKNALVGWRTLIDSEHFWQAIKHRVEVLNDPQLTSGLVRRIRDILPIAIVNINAQNALSAAERGDTALVKIYTQLLRKNANSSAEEALRSVLEPIRKRITGLCEQSTQKAEEHPERGNQAVTDLLEQTKPLLNTIDLLLAEQDVLRTGTHDAVAEAAMQSVIKFGNKTENWKETLRLLDIAIPIAGGAAQRVRMEENRKTAQTNYESDCCYFCGVDNADPERAVKVEMYGDVERIPKFFNQVEITWRHITIKIPRCLDCASINNKRSNVFFIITPLVWIFAVFIIINLANKAPDADLSFLVFISIFFGPAIGLIAGPMLVPLNGRKGESEINEFPKVKELYAQGWRFGERP